MDRSTISVVINTKNSAKTLKHALASCSFADEIIVADMNSTDDTVEVAKKFNAKIITVADANYVEPARNKAISAASSDWIFVLDSDESIPAGLKDFVLEILQLDKQSQVSAVAYHVPRQNIIFGKAMTATGWWPDWQVRFFRKGSVKFNAKIHGVPEIMGESAQVPLNAALAINHQNYQSVSQFIDRLNRYTTIEAQGNEPIGNLSVNSLIKTWGDEVLSRSFAQHASDDGIHGTALALLQAYYPVVTLLKQWEHNDFKTNRSQSDVSLEMVKSWQQFQKNLAYWLANERVYSTHGLTKIWWMIRRKFAF